MELSLTQAAKETGRSKSTIHRAIKSGKLSATRHEDGSYSIDPAELFRAYPKEPPEPVAVTQEGTPSGTGGTDMGTKADVLRVKVEMLTQQLEREQETVTDLRRRLDKAEDRLLALSAPAPVGKPKEGIWTALWGLWNSSKNDRNP